MKNSYLHHRGTESTEVSQRDFFLLRRPFVGAWRAMPWLSLQEDHREKIQFSPVPLPLKNHITPYHQGATCCAPTTALSLFSSLSLCASALSFCPSFSAP